MKKHKNKPNEKDEMKSCSDVRLWEEMLVTVSLDVKGRDVLQVRFLNFFW